MFSIDFIFDRVLSINFLLNFIYEDTYQLIISSAQCRHLSPALMANKYCHKVVWNLGGHVYIP